MDFICKVRGVYGFGCAIEGMREAFNSESDSDIFQVENGLRTFSIGVKDKQLMIKLINKGNSHAKFMRFIMVWLYICAPRYWWQEFDTYKIGVERLSQSTMHTIKKRELNRLDFIHGVDETSIEIVNMLIRKSASVGEIKKNLPEGFLQGRRVIANYQALRGMIVDRLHHKLEEWHIFIESILNQLPHTDLLTAGMESEFNPALR